MYVSSNEGGAFHIWRQRFSDGRLEQVTSGTTEEAGIAMTADGTALLTSVGVYDRTIWLHDATGEHQLSSEGSTFNTKFSVDGTRLFYLMQSGESGSSLWVRTLATGASERVVSGSAVQPGSTIRAYAVSHDGRQAALQIDNAAGDSRIWIVPVDRRSAPRQLVSPRSEDSPAFLPNGDLIVRATEGGRNYLYRTGPGGVGRQRVISEPIVDLLSVSPDGRWVAAMAMARDPGHDEPGVVIYSLEGGSAVPVCNFDCLPAWDLTGNFLYLISGWDATTYILPVNAARGIPDLPAGGFNEIADLQSDKRAIKVGDVIDSGIGKSIYAHTKQSTRRNIYRIPLPE
jgi:Tol biopolymer transport system component